MQLQEKIVTIIGAQRSGVAAARLALRLNARPRISEAGKAEAFDSATLDWMTENKVDYECGGHTQAFIEASDLVVLSPGVRPDARPVVWAKAAGIPVLGEIEFAAQYCLARIIGVTGSNGKTTVVTLIQQVLQAAGKKSFLCGNVGRAFSEDVLNIPSTGYVVLELSSFQLEALARVDLANESFLIQQFSSYKPFCPHVAVFLNFSQNHLDRHKDLDEYFEAKTRLFLNQTDDDFAILNAADDRVSSLADVCTAQSVLFDHLSDGGHGCEDPNHLAVTAVADVLGIEKSVCLGVFNSFKGVEHRLENVRVLDGVEFINDSKATTTEATRRALTQIGRPIILICGGRDKNVDFNVLDDLVRKKVKLMIVFGEAKDKIRGAFKDLVPLSMGEDLEHAVKTAQASAENGDSILLSPMCTSFDMFTDYEQRGNAFKDIVQQLASVAV